MSQKLQSYFPLRINLWRKKPFSLETFGKNRWWYEILVLPGGSLLKKLPVSAGATGDVGSISVLGRSLEEEMATQFSILAGTIPWTEEPCGL